MLEGRQVGGRNWSRVQTEWREGLGTQGALRTPTGIRGCNRHGASLSVRGIFLPRDQAMGAVKRFRAPLMRFTDRYVGHPLRLGAETERKGCPHRLAMAMAQPLPGSAGLSAMAAHSAIAVSTRKGRDPGFSASLGLRRHAGYRRRWRRSGAARSKSARLRRRAKAMLPVKL